MLDLNDLRVFAYVASLKSFSLAADELEINKSSVSRSISRLERMLNAPLLQRTTRKVNLTCFGTELQQRCDEMLTRVSEPISFVGNASPLPAEGLTVCVDSGLEGAAQLQNRLLPQFLESHRELRPCIRYTSSKLALRANDVDIALFLDSPTSGGQLGSVTRQLYASPDYLLRRGVPTTHAQLQDHDIVVGDDVDPRAAMPLDSAIAGRGTPFDPRASIVSNEPLVAHGLVLAGVGIGCLLDHLCKEDLRAGRLVRLLPEIVFAPLRINLAYPSNRQGDPAIRAFVDLLKTEMKLRRD
jgi:DNA-binding transcriptional LysR family regulator